MPKLTPIILLTLLVACDETNNQSASHAPRQSSSEDCNCSANQVAYDNGGSRLHDQTVQGAIDELAARPDDIELADRIQIVEKKMTAPAEHGNYIIVVGCPRLNPDGESGRALGGACLDASTDPAISLRHSDFTASSYECAWNKPKGKAIEFTAKVTCLMPSK
jgi:hypothetical protein